MMTTAQLKADPEAIRWREFYKSLRPRNIFRNRREFLRNEVNDGATCPYCNCNLEHQPRSSARVTTAERHRAATLDHVVPRKQGGTNDDSNLIACCASCNSRKGARTPEQAGMRLSWISDPRFY